LETLRQLGEARRWPIQATVRQQNHFSYSLIAAPPLCPYVSCPPPTPPRLKLHPLPSTRRCHRHSVRRLYGPLFVSGGTVAFKLGLELEAPPQPAPPDAEEASSWARFGLFSATFENDSSPLTLKNCPSRSLSATISVLCLLRAGMWPFTVEAKKNSGHHGIFAW